MPSRTSLLILSLVALAILPATRAPAAPDVQTLAQFPTRPDALLSVDMNRSAVVEKITAAWNKELLPAQRDSFKSKLSSLRADGLLAASLSGSFDGVLEIINSLSLAEIVSSPSLASAQGYFASQTELKSIANSFIPAAQNTAFLNQSSQNLSADSAKALGDANADLVYTPLAPCRLFDTRAGLASAMGTVGGTFSNQQTKTISPAGACGIPTSGVASLFLSFHAYNNNPSTLGVIGFMKPTAPFSALAATWTGANWATGTYITQTNPNGSFDAFVGNGQSMTADMIVDVMGYFRAPQGTIAAGSGDITDVLTAAGSGLTGGVTSGAANLSIASTYKLPQACANGQVAKYNTSTLVWECGNDLQGTGGGGAGTVTNIATGAGLSGGPITSTGTINLASTQLLPTTACAANQIPKWNGSSWACAADATGASGGSGTVTSVATGAGLTGGPITAAGTIGLAASQLLPTTACADSQTLIWNATSSNWICAGWTPPSAVANAFVNGGNSFGADAVLGTNDANRLFIKSGNTMSFYAPESFFLQSGSTSPSRSGFTQIYSSGIENFYASPSEVRVATEKGRIEVVDKFNTVNIRAGSIFNQAGNASKGQTISGGGELTDNCLSQSQTTYGASCTNQTNGDFAVVSGGAGNSAREGYATVSGGSSNRALGSASVVSGGFGNTANAVGSVVAGGQLNTAGSSITTGIGDNSFVAGGTKNYTQGYASFAAGERAKAFHDNSFVWGGSGVDTNSAGVGTFTAYAPGGFYFFRGSVGAGGCVLPAGVVSWSCTSDRATKSNIQALNPLDTLRRVVAMPVARWNYIGTEKIKNVGPMAQDFFKAFSLGDSDKTIASMNMSGVALSAIQGLNQKLTEQVKTKDAEISALKARLQAIEKKLGL
jgi:hypothetical protein